MSLTFQSPHAPGDVRYVVCPICRQAVRVDLYGNRLSVRCAGQCPDGDVLAALDAEAIIAELRGQVAVEPVEPSENGHEPPGRSVAVQEPSSWQPMDLEPVLRGEQIDAAPMLLSREDGVCLLYDSKIHQAAGEPESCKGWLGLHAIASVLEAGDCAAYIDLEDNELTIVARLRALGCSDEAIGKRLLYMRPHEPLDGQARIDFDAVLSCGPKLVVIDGVTEALTLLGLDLADNADIARWLELVPRRIVRAGAAVLLIDHVTKDREARGRFAIGAQHKLAGIDVSYGLEVIRPFGRGRDGLVKVTVHKDRAGHVRRHAHDGGRIAELVLSSDLESGEVNVALRPPEGEDGTFRPTVLMGRIAAAIAAEPGMTTNAIRRSVKGKNDAKQQALTLLIRERYVDPRHEGQARRHYLLKPFPEDDRAPAPQPAPDRAPAQSSTTAPRAPTPVGGTVRGASAEGPSNSDQPRPDRCRCSRPAASPRADGAVCRNCHLPLVAEASA